MRLLVLGGTVFLGRHVVAEALAGGVEVTIFTRGRTNPELFAEAEHLTGDRDGGLEALRGRQWDGVVDTSGYVPRIVEQSGELLRDAVGRYVFVSSISAYADFSRAYDEEAPTAELADPADEDVVESYGPLKAACERVIDGIYGGRATQVRAGLIVGPHDPTDRFTYWCERVAEGGEVLAPGRPDQPVQFVDVRDLACFLIDLAADGVGGPLNATGPAEPLSLGELLARMSSLVDRPSEFSWVASDLLVSAGVEPWTELPLWLPGQEWAGLMAARIGRAQAAGLRFRPLEQTVADTLAWASGDRERRATLTRVRERELLARSGRATP